MGKITQGLASLEEDYVFLSEGDGELLGEWVEQRRDMN